MRQQIWVRLALTSLVLITAASSFGDELTDRMVSNDNLVYIGTIRSFGLLACSGGLSPEKSERGKAQTKQFYWAFEPDAHLNMEELKQETKCFEDQWASLMAVSKDFGVSKVWFIGCDVLGTAQYMDIYLEAGGPKGPVVFKISVAFGLPSDPHCRIFGFESYTGWEKVKQVLSHIQHPANPDKVLTITLDNALEEGGGEPPSTRPSR